ncbi:MAG TPA: serine--tRNA ligase, partial [Thermoanaerobaculia bacterium]|nr:serine--tRNA ligase [Thermoanaerobaculia bacterium]
RNDPDRVRAALAARRDDADPFERWLGLDEERRQLLVEVEELKRRRNEASRAIGEVKQRGGDAAVEITAVADLKGEIEALESRLAAVESDAEEIARRLPNLPHDSLPAGGEAEGRVERSVGTPRDFAAEGFAPRPHWDLGPELGILDFERGAKVTGARFTVLAGAGALLERALVSFMLDLHTRRHGYTEVLPPFLVNAESMFGTGQLPKFAADAFKVEGHDWYLVPTAEVPVTNLHRDEVLDEAELPRRYAAYTPCFRSEAGSYGKDVRGLIRQHQFQKVELVCFSRPEESWDELERLTGHAEAVLSALGLPYRVVTLATGDVGFAAAKTYDLEVWLPGQDAYREISSCSNFTDFQARRANLRYRPADGGKPRHLHTLNGSGLAVGRTLVALLENYQQADGSVVVPEALQPWAGGLERIAVPGDG